ncbi:hypothetical protein PLICRDRAFT_25913 [Plicaturopsis crispa FD-325 SS-3]|nr:hypothetical protein PLICRDRAFT_25913 [Plicaturopsis crispa FD-325 SS-3]
MSPPASVHGDPNSGVGLSDRQLSQGRRNLLDLVNRLHSTGVQIDMDLPMIAVIGSQSAGKSSLIESISGITLPRAAGTCTRCPTECRLSHSDEAWRCEVFLRYLTDENGQPLGQVRNERFGVAMSDKAEVEERIRRAQRAILNPKTPFKHFLDGDDEDPDVRQLTFSKNYVSLQISGKDVADLSFVDLPGLIASVGKGGDAGDIELVKNLVSSYIERPSCLILLTVACETDFENQGAHHLAKQNDPDGKRTIGVLTKPDRIPAGEEDNWLRFIRNEYEPLANNWYCVKQPNSSALKQGISWAEARSEEDNFFSMTSPWSGLESIHQQYLRTSNLTTRLSIILSDLIGKRLPEIQEELQKLLEKTKDSLRQLPKPPSPDPVGEILQKIGKFTRDLSRHLEGTPTEDGLLQSIRPAQLDFQRAIRNTAPEFRPYERKHAQSRSLPKADFLSNEEEAREEEQHVIKAVDPIYIDDVLSRAQKARTRELPDNYPFVVHEGFISEVVEKWNVPSQLLYQSVQRTLTSYVKKVIADHFEAFGNGGLQQRVMLVVSDHLKTCGDNATRKIEWLLQLEQRPFTLNTHYYSDYKDKFMSYYKGARELGENSSLLTNLQSYKPHTHPQLATGFTNSMSKAMSGLTEVGFSGLKPTDLPKLLPADPYEPALNIMAGVRAYFQVAYKRFMDNIPLAIDRELIRGLERDLEQALYKGLGVSGPDGHRVCTELVQEHPSISVRREELKNKWERLNTASHELVNIGI